MLNTARAIAAGLKTHLRRGSEVGTGGTNRARYCYTVWLRHLSLLHQRGLPLRPGIVAELGPGDSIGTGLAALISGAQTYFALDALDHTQPGRDALIFDELVELFRARAPIPDATEFPRVHPQLPGYAFPDDVLPEPQLEDALQPERLGRLRRDLQAHRVASGSVRYFAPWQGKNVIAPGEADLVFSQAVLEYVDDLPQVYRALYKWLRPGGAMSHEIDFGAHDNFGETWNAHWGYSELTWQLIRGKRTFFLNRQPLSAHLAELRAAGFRVVHVERLVDTRGLGRNQLGRRFRELSDEDRCTRKAHLLAVKP